MTPLLDAHLRAAGCSPSASPADWPAFVAGLDAALVHADAERQRIEVELRLAQQLEAVGQLAAGVAHEINTPVQYVGDTLHFIRTSVAALQGWVTLFAAQRGALEGIEAANAPLRALDEATDELDLAYVTGRLPGAFERAFDGLERVNSLVRAIKEFAHPDRPEHAPADLNRAVETTLSVARAEYKSVAEVTTRLGVLPPVPCHVGQIHQVLLNLVVNAAHAIGDRPDRRGLGRITIETSVADGHAVLSVSDDGGGIPAHIGDRVFQPFFTTKEVGRGTGQGLALARAIVVGGHGGTLAYESVPASGTVFTVRLPLAGTPVAP